MYSPSIQKLIDLFSKFPTVGPRTAARFVFYLLRLQKEEIKELTSAILKLQENVKLCKFCYKSFETELSQEAKVEKSAKTSLTTRAAAKGGKEDKSSLTEEGELCEICRDPRRNKALICVVEKETDLIPIEKTKKYQGLYFILGGTIPALKKDYNPPTTLPSKGRAPELKKLRIQELLERIKGSEIGEEDKSSSSPFAAAQVKEVIIALNPTTEGEATILYLERTLKPLGKKITRLGRGLPTGGELEYADEETLSSALESRR